MALQNIDYLQKLKSVMSTTINKVHDGMWENRNYNIIRIIEVLIIILALVSQWYSHSFGLLLTDDSFHYIAGSDSFSNHSIMLDSDNNHFLFWPPLFSMVLSITGWTGELINWVYLICEFIICLLVIKMGNRVIANPLIKTLYLVFALMGVHLLMISTFLWSELFFLLLALSFLYFTQKSKISSISLWLALLTGFLMCLQRNSGLFIAAGAAIWLIFGNIEEKGNFKFALIFFLTVISGQICWNIYVWSYLPHPQFDFSNSLFQNALENSNAFSQAIVYAFIPFKRMAILSLTIVSFGLMYFLKNYIQSNRSLQLVFIVSSIYIIGIYFILIINIAGFEIDFGVGDRFVSIILPFISLLVFKGFDVLLINKSRYVKYFIILFLIGWMSYPIARTVKNAHQWHQVSMTNSRR